MIYKLEVSAEWFNRAGGPDGTGTDQAMPSLSNSACCIYVVVTATTQATANTLLTSPSASNACFLHAGSTAMTFSISSTASTVYAAALAVRPGCEWRQYGTAARIYTNSTTKIECGLYNLCPGKMLVREGYINNLFTYSTAVTTSGGYEGRQLNLKSLIDDIHVTSVTVGSRTATITKDYGKMSDIATYAAGIPYTAARYVAVNTVYFPQSVWKTEGITGRTHGQLVSYDIGYDIYIPSSCNVGQAEVFVADGPNEGSSTSLASHNYADWGSGIEGTNSFSITTSADTLYVGIVLDQNPNNRTVNVSVTAGATTTTTGTYAEAAIDLMGGTTDNFSFSITMY